MKKLLTFLILFTGLGAFSQSPEAALNTVREDYAAEKIYLHFDKPFYMSGETIWFKAYLMEGFTPSVRSSVICVELLNDSGGIVDKKILPVAGSTAVGDFTLPAQLPRGEYIVKAYTRYLMNFGFDAFHYERLYVFGSDAVNTTRKEGLMKKYELHFLPESGNLIYNIVNTIAFKCTDNSGKPVSVAGKILDADGREQTTFNSAHDGMGTFLFVPRSGASYRAEYTINGNPQVQALQPAVAEGVMLNIVRKNDKSSFILDASTVVSPNLRPSYILGVQENMIVFKVAVPENAKRLNGEIPVAQLPSGILQLTVFNALDKPLAERLLFINSGDYIAEGNFKINQVNLAARSLNAFSFELSDTVPGTFSVSVTDAGTDYHPDGNLVSGLLLTSELKGRIYNPGYYFEANDAIHQQGLDLVMLTHGWRRYSWTQLLSGKFPPMTFKDPGLITINGEAFHPTTNKPLANTGITVVAKTKDKNMDFFRVMTNAEGKFTLEGLTFEDSATLVLSANNTKNSKLLARAVSPGLSHLFKTAGTKLPTFVDDDSVTAARAAIAASRYGLAKFNGIVLEEIRVTAKNKTEKEKYESRYVTGSLGGVPAKTLDFISEPVNSDQNIFNYLQGRVSGVRISGGPLNYSINYRNSMSLSSGVIPMNLFLDEIQVDASQIATMRISDIALINVYSSGGLAGGAGGALAIYTKRGDGFRRSEDMARQTIEVEGFSPTKEFFSPDYAAPTDEHVTSDERSTLYWNPYMISTATNKVIRFSYHNSDKAKIHRIILQGMLENGKLLHLEKVIQ